MTSETRVEQQQWRVSNMDVWAGDVVVATTNPNQMSFPGERTYDESRELAKRIIRAVNSHDDLLAALEEAQNSIDWFEMLMEDGVILEEDITSFDATALQQVRDFSEQARAAIKRARGED